MIVVDTYWPKSLLVGGGIVLYDTAFIIGWNHYRKGHKSLYSTYAVNMRKKSPKISCVKKTLLF